MTEEQKQTIERLRNVGLGYRKIAIVLDLSRDKVRNYCKANGLDGYAKKRLQAKEGKQMEEDCADIIAEGLLLPECLVRASMAFFQFPDTLSHISRSQLDMNYPSFKKMARQLGVQRQLLANRMKYLHILTSDVPYRHTLSLMEAG